ncbi:MAG: hypothetical protein Q9191_006587 [Dirinaria sp. TL-2023a]
MFGSRTQSGPGGLSINTSSANALGANSSSQPPKSGGLFGSLQQQQQPKSTGFGSSNPAVQSTGNTLFGTANTNSGGGLFGPTTTTSQSQGSGLFGTAGTTQGGGLLGTPSTAAQPQQSNNIFGAGLSGAQGSSNQQNQGTGLSGSLSAQSNSVIGNTQNQSGGLFGSLGQMQNQASQARSSGIFGNPSSQQKPTPLFCYVKAYGSSGSTITQPQAQTQTQPQAPSAPSIFTSSIGQLSQQQQTVPGVRVSVNELRPTTRFNDLHEELQKIIENIDNFVLDQMRFQSECETAIKDVEDASRPVPNEVENCQTALDAVQQALENDAQAIDEVKKLSNADASNAKLSFNAVATLRLPQQFQRSTAWYAPGTSHLTAPSLIDDDVEGAPTSLLSYFSNQADELTKTLNSHKGRMSEVQAYLDGLEVSMVNRMQQLIFAHGEEGGSKSVEDQVKELAAVLREMESGISGVAGKIPEILIKSHVAANKARAWQNVRYSEGTIQNPLSARA